MTSSQLRITLENTAAEQGFRFSRDAGLDIVDLPYVLRFNGESRRQLFIRPVIPYAPDVPENDDPGSGRYASCGRLPSLFEYEKSRFDLVFSERVTLVLERPTTSSSALEQTLRLILLNMCSFDPSILRFSHDPKDLNRTGDEDRLTFKGGPLLDWRDEDDRPFLIADATAKVVSPWPSDIQVRFMEARFITFPESDGESYLIRLDFAFETMLCFANSNINIFETDLFSNIMSELMPVAILRTVKRDVAPGVESFADLLRALVFLGAADTRSPRANLYARSFARKASFFASLSGLPGGAFRRSVEPIIRDNEQRYPILRARSAEIMNFVGGLERDNFHLPEGVRSGR